MQQSHLPPRFSQSNSLITPSASPPPRHASVQQQQYYNRSAMSAPPLKKQRVSSTPRRTLHDPSPASSSSRSQPPIDIEKEREASRLRLLSAWDNLTRLVRPLDEDDIINLRTGKITRDNGVLRNTPRINFGNMLNPADNDGGDEDTDSADEAEDEADELDTLSERPLDIDETTEIDFEAGAKVLPPVTPLDPQDNEDLQEFLRAEQKRRELCGSEPESEEEGDEEEVEGSQEEFVEGVGPDDVYDEDDDTGQNRTHEENPTERPYSPDIFQTPSYPEDSSDAGVGFSDDELDVWGVDDASIVQPVASHEEDEEEVAAAAPAPTPVSDSDSDIEIIDGPYIQSSPIRPTAPKLNQGPVPPKAKSESPQKKKSAMAQYLTPPHSGTSLNRSASLGESDSQHRAGTCDVSSLNGPFCPPLSRETVFDIPRVDLSRLHKGKRPTFIRADSSTGAIGSSTPPHTLTKIVIPKTKPIVLLTPRRLSVPPQVKNPPSSSRADVKGKQSALLSSHTEKLQRLEPSVEPASKPSSPAKRTSHKKSASKAPSDSTSVAGPSQVRDKAHKSEPSLGSGRQDQYDSSTMSSPRKRKRRSSSGDPHQWDTTSRSERRQLDSSSESDEIPLPPTRKKRSSSRRRERVSPSESDSEDMSSANERNRTRRASTSRPRTPSHLHQTPSYFPDSYPSRNSMPPFGPIPDPRAQFIITQAMQQLSALVTGNWITPYDNATPPTYYPDPRYPNPYSTPTHRHHHPRYDPTFSSATLPPDSPEPSPEKSANGRRKSLVRRSRSRGRKVSFHIADNTFSQDRSSSPPLDQDCNSSPTKPPRERLRKRGTPFSGKGKARETTCDLSEHSESETGKRSTYVRGQTPGPSWQSGEKP